MIKKIMEQYVNTHQIVKDLKPKKWVLFQLFGVFLSLLLFGIGYSVLYALDLENQFIYGLILFQIVGILCYVLFYHLQHKALQKTHSISYNIKSLFLIDFILFLTLFVGIQTLLLFYAYSAVTVPIFMIFCVVLSSLLLILWIIITLHLVNLELYYKQFHLFLTLILFQVIIMRFIPFSAIWIYVISFMVSYILFVLIYDIKPILDLKNPIKLPKTIVYIIVGCVLFLTFSIIRNDYFSYFYQDIQIQPETNTRLIYSVSQDLNNHDQINYAVDNDYTYIQLHRKLIVLEDGKMIHEIDLPDDHHLLPSSSGVLVAHMKELIEDDSEEYPYLYDFYSLNSNFDYVLTKSLAMKYRVYGYVRHDNIDYFESGSVAFLFENDIYLKMITLYSTTNDEDIRVRPILIDQNLNGIGLTLEEDIVMLPSSHYTVMLPWIEQINNNLLFSFSTTLFLEAYAIIESSSIEPLSIFERSSFFGVSYIKTNNYQFLMQGWYLEIYDASGKFLEGINLRNSTFFPTRTNIYINVTSYSTDYDIVTNQIYSLDMEKPYLYSLSNGITLPSILFTLSLSLIYLIIDRRKVISV